MFELLTKYLLLYKKVSIPSVGTIQLLQQPAQLDVAGKVILPPSYTCELVPADDVSEHQSAFLSAAMETSGEEVQESLESLGLRIKEEFDGEGFHWRGIGIFQRQSNAQILPIAVESLGPVAAERIIRQGAEHQVLIGDQQYSSTQIAGLRDEPIVSRKSSILVIIGWIIFALSILFIIFILWQGKFRMHATGSKSSPVGFVQNH